MGRTFDGEVSIPFREFTRLVPCSFLPREPDPFEIDVPPEGWLLFEPWLLLEVDPPPQLCPAPPELWLPPPELWLLPPPE